MGRVMDSTAVTTRRTAGRGGDPLPSREQGEGRGWLGERASQEELMKGEENILAVYGVWKRPFCRYCVFVS